MERFDCGIWKAHATNSAANLYGKDCSKTKLLQWHGTQHKRASLRMEHKMEVAVVPNISCANSSVSLVQKGLGLFTISEGRATKFSSRHQGPVATIGWKPSLKSADANLSIDNAATSLSTSLSAAAAAAEDGKLPPAR